MRVRMLYGKFTSFRKITTKILDKDREHESVMRYVKWDLDQWIDSSKYVYTNTNRFISFKVISDATPQARPSYSCNKDCFIGVDV